MDTLKQRLEEVKAGRVSTYRIFDLALDIARTEEEFQISATYLYVTEFTGADFKIRLNDKQNDLIPLKDRRAIRGAISRIFITHTAQATKTIKLIFGISTDFFVEDT